MCGELLRPNSCLVHFRGHNLCPDFLRCCSRLRARILAESRELIPFLDACSTCGQDYNQAHGHPLSTATGPAMDMNEALASSNNNAMEAGASGLEEDDDDDEELEEAPPPRYHRRDPNRHPALRARAREMTRDAALETPSVFNIHDHIEPENDSLPPPSYDTVRFMDQYSREDSFIQTRGSDMAHEFLRRRNAVRATPEPNRFSTSGLQNSLMNGLARSNPFQGFAAGRFRAPLTRQRGRRNLRQGDDWMG